MVAAFEFKRFFDQRRRQARLLFLAHRQETFGNFIRYHDYKPGVLLVKESWSEW